MNSCIVCDCEITDGVSRHFISKKTGKPVAYCETHYRIKYNKIMNRPREDSSPAYDLAAIENLGLFDLRREVRQQRQHIAAMTASAQEQQQVIFQLKDALVEAGYCLNCLSPLNVACRCSLY